MPLATAQAEPAAACDLPADLLTPEAPLTHVAAALTGKGTLDILALGSGSTVGEGGRSGGPLFGYHAPETAFPYRMISALESMRPKLRFQLTVQGGRNMTADMMLPILHKQLALQHFDLVLWQTGTVEAVHGLRPDALRADLQEGADAVDAANADLVLIDPQFSRFLRANVDLGPYQTVLEQMTGNPGVTLFRRFDLTQAWVNSGQVDLESVDKDARDKTILLLNDCLGQALAKYILAGAIEH
jgi:hypothetical protein